MIPEKTMLDLLGGDPLVRMLPHATVTEASREMLRHHIGAVVIEEKDQTIGILTERDINYRVVASGRDTTALLRDVMTPDPTLIPPNTKASDALRQVVHHRYRYALVGQDRKAIGIVLISRIFAEVTKNLDNNVDEIDAFIRDGVFSDRGPLH